MKFLFFLTTLTALAQDPLLTHAVLPWFNDPAYTLELPGQWYLTNAGSPWTLRHNGAIVQTVPGGSYDIHWQPLDARSVKVAIIDTGCEPHADLPAIIGDQTDWHGHGTALAGIVAATRDNHLGMAGVANAQLLAYRTDWTSPQMAAGIHWAVEQGAKVILIAWGETPFNPALSNACRRAWHSNALLVCATPITEYPLGTYTDYPHSFGFSNTLPVSAADQFARRYVGAPGALLAPGRGIIRTSRSNSFHYANGTSSSAAVAAGCAAILYARYPAQSAQAIRDALLATNVLYLDRALAYPIPRLSLHGNSLTVHGPTGWVYALEHSVNLVDWSDQSIVRPNQPIPVNPGFYRARIP